MNKNTNINFYTPLTNEYFNDYLNREIFAINSQQWIYSVYYALYKISNSVNDEDVNDNTLKVLFKQSFATTKFPPDINHIINYIQEYKNTHNTISIKDILVSNCLLHDIYYNKFNTFMPFIKEKYCEIYNKINTTLDKLNSDEIKRILNYKIHQYYIGDMYAFADYELTRKCFDYYNRINQDCYDSVKRKFVTKAHIDCKLFGSFDGKETYNISINLYFKNNIKRTAYDLRFDEVVFNIIQFLIYTKLQQISRDEEGDIFISFKEITNMLYGETKNTSIPIRNRVLESIYYMAYCVNCEINLSDIAEHTDLLKNDNLQQTGIKEIIDNINSDNYIIKQPLLPIKSIGHAEYNNNILMEGIFVYKQSSLYLIPYFMGFIRNIHFNQVTDISKFCKGDSEEDDKNKSQATRKTIIVMTLTIYLIRRIEAKFRRKIKDETTIDLDSLYEYFGLQYNENLAATDRNSIKKERYKLKQNVIKILDSMKFHGYVVDYYIEEEGLHRKPCGFKIQLKKIKNKGQRKNV